MTYKVTTVRGTMTRHFWSPACATYPYCACVVLFYTHTSMHSCTALTRGLQDGAISVSDHFF